MSSQKNWRNTSLNFLVIIDSSYRVVVEAKASTDFKNETSILESNNNYDGYDLSALFNVYFEKDGKKDYSLDAKNLKIYISKDSIKGLEEDTKLFYFDDEGKVREVSYKIVGDYVEFVLPTSGRIGFGNDKVTWIWTLLLVQTSGLMILILILFLRQKLKTKRA